MNRIEMSAVATVDDPVDQVRETMSSIRAQLRKAGGRPSDLTSMSWAAERPARFHLSRRAIDLAYREVFSGSRPAITLRPGSGRLAVSAIAEIVPLDNEQAVWRSYTLAALSQQMTPRNKKSMDEVFRKWREHAQAFRGRHKDAVYDLRYGPSEYETFDIFYPERTTTLPSLWVFLHGGGHQASDKSDMSHYATAMLQAGYAVAMPNYGLCPDVSLERIFDQLRRCMLFLYRESGAFEFDNKRIHIAGSSAGAHLAALLVTDPELSFIRSALPISGIMDLKSKVLLQGKILGVETPEICIRLSPLSRTLNPGVRVGVVVGGAESEEFRLQSSLLAKAWGCSFLEVKDKDHFDIKEALEVGGPLLDFALQVASDGDVAPQQARRAV